MEDRQPTGLLLEMLRGDDPADVESWQQDVAIPKAMASGWFTNGTAFRNLRPDESRFPQKVDPFTHLTVYEVARPDVAWTCMEGLPEDEGGIEVVDRILYRRYPRPSQGRLSGKSTLGLFLILISPTERARAQELRDWADFTHLHGIAASAPDGFTMITPYENVAGDDPMFLHLYELDTPDVAQAVDAMPEAVIKRFGFALGDDDFMNWAMHDALDIWYVNVFGRV